MTLFGTFSYLPGALRQILLLVLVSGTVLLFILEMQYSLNAQIESMLLRVVELKEEQGNLETLHLRLASDVNNTLESMKGQMGQIETLEQNSKRNNLRIYGIPENDPSENTLELVKELIENIGIPIGDVIDDAIREQNSDSPRPILVKFTRWKEKTRILRRRRAFSASIRIEEDLTELQKHARRLLEEYAEKADKEGKKVRWNGKQLFVDGEIVKL